MNLDSRLFSLPNRDELIASFGEKSNRFLSSLQLWEVNSLPVSVAPSGQARIFEGGKWKLFDSWELMSEGTPLSFFLFNLRWQDLIAEDEYLHSYRGPHEKQSSIEVEFKRVLTAANSTIMWMLADYDGAERLEVYRLFEARLETHATHLQQKKTEFESQGHQLVAGWGSKFMKERGVGALAFLQLQLDICIRLERRPIRLSSQVEVVHFLLNDPRNTFNERMRAETDVLNERDRGKIRQEWNEYTYQTSRQLAAEAVDEAQDDELQLLMRFDDFVYAKFTKRVTE